MALDKDKIMPGMQKFGGAMYAPVILFAFFGLTVALSIVCKNEGLLGSLAAQGTVWYDFWYVVEQGAWTVFSQMPILFAIAVPIGFAKKEPARCAMEAFVIYMVFNYFISAFLTLHGDFFGVDFSQDAGAGTGLAMIANIKTLDMGMLGAIFIACITAWLHNRFYDTDIPDWLCICRCDWIRCHDSNSVYFLRSMACSSTCDNAISRFSQDKRYRWSLGLYFF